MKTQFFRKIYNVVALDTELRGSALKLYLVLNALADLKTRQVIIYIETLAEKTGISSRQVRRSLAVLIELGLVERVLRKSEHNPRMNLASLFIVHDIDAKRYGGSGDVSQICQQRQNCQHLRTKLSAPTNKDGRAKNIKKNKEDLKKENNNNTVENVILRDEKTLIGKSDSKIEAVLETEEKNISKTEKSIADAFNDVPDTFCDTINYLFKCTGRKKLYDSEVEILRKLSHKTELPRVKKLLEKLIDEAVERFIRKGRPLINVTINYLAKALENQLHSKKAQTDSQDNSKTQNKPLKSTENTATTKTETKQAEAKPEIKPELTMSVEEAEKAIADYAQDKKRIETLPTALLELFGKIQEKHNERAANSEQLTLEDYLHIRFPEAEDEELHRDYWGKVHEDYRDFPRAQLLEDAFKIDYACAICDDPHHCRLPIKYKQYRQSRPIAQMTPSKDFDGKFLEAYCNGCIKCKFPPVGKTKEDYDFEDRVRHSGLAVNQVNQTFDTFDHQNAAPEVVVAKAQAMLAAKNKSNLILAGKPGTGKSHLASAIALEAMKNGNKAIFKSLPELLDEICFAYQNNTDPYGLMIKYKTVKCLVLDDWGKEKTTDARLDYLFQIIDYRYRNGLQTILTTNAFNAEGLKNRWNADKIEPLVSRILENGQWVTICDSENYRLKNKSKPEVLEPKTQEKAASSEVSITSETKDSQKLQEPEIEVPEKTPSSVVPVVDSDKTENFSEPETSPKFATSVSPAPKIEPKLEPLARNRDRDRDRENSSYDEPRRISEIFSTASAEKKEEEEPTKSWQEISESAEYKAMSEAEKITKQWEFFRETPDYEKLTLFDKVAVQRGFFIRIEEAEKRGAQSAQQPTEQSGIVITVPVHDDGLDDDDNELNL